MPSTARTSESESVTHSALDVLDFKVVIENEKTEKKERPLTPVEVSMGRATATSIADYSGPKL